LPCDAQVLDARIEALDAEGQALIVAAADAAVA